MHIRTVPAIIKHIFKHCIKLNLPKIISMKKIQLTLFMMLLIFQGFAQSLQVKGKVSSSDGTGIPGVSVSERGTSNGSVTSADGNYTIKVASGANWWTSGACAPYGQRYNQRCTRAQFPFCCP
jgi:hypothetical protein